MDVGRVRGDGFAVSLDRFGVPSDVRAVYGDFRAGDVRHSQADIGKAVRLLGYEPSHDIGAGIRAAMAWYTGCAQEKMI